MSVLNDVKPRRLTREERALIRRLVEHGTVASSELMSRVDTLRVVSTYPCGCPSIDFIRPLGVDLTVVADYFFDYGAERWGGVFLFACEGRLAGLEVWSVDGLGTPPLPAPESPRPDPVCGPLRPA